jgi:beta-lactam-binding protein with PASTA domain
VRRSFSDQPPDTVVGQDPQAGAAVAPGAQIVLTASKGPEALKVPNVVGQDLDAAQPALEQQGFSVQVEERRSAQPHGRILEQQPKAGANVPPGSAIHLIVAR